MTYIITIILSYILGSINPALILGWYKKVDVRKSNSRNPGASNVAMTFGMKYAIYVGVFDILKGVIPVVITKLLFPDLEVLWFVAGFSAIFGHIFPVFLKFKGGKGTATFGGMLLALNPLPTLVLALLYFGLLFVWDYIAISTLFASLIVPLYMYLNDYETASIMIMLSFALISIYKHLPNFYRIISFQEVGIKRAFRKK